jgi:dihydrodipicolinate synthase/N-acetylneuraminate lyase
MMRHRALGVISVIANICPKAMNEMVTAFLNGQISEAERLHYAMKPLFDIVGMPRQRVLPLTDRTIIEKIKDGVRALSRKLKPKGE